LDDPYPEFTIANKIIKERKKFNKISLDNFFLFRGRVFPDMK